jgi:hypothetical protein
MELPCCITALQLTRKWGAPLRALAWIRSVIASTFLWHDCFTWLVIVWNVDIEPESRSWDQILSDCRGERHLVEISNHKRDSDLLSQVEFCRTCIFHGRKDSYDDWPVFVTIVARVCGALQRSGKKQKDMGCGQSTCPKCYLDLAINGSVIGRLVIELRQDKVPKTAENFRALCTGENGNSYRGSTIHRIIPGFIAQVLILHYDF